MENSFLIVGLGNPGREYQRTRHNAGFLLIDFLAERWKLSWSSDNRLKAFMAKGEREGRRVLLCKPQTFMNLSGDSVGAVCRYYHVALKKVMVVVDDADLGLGQIRMRISGSSGGHHGLESIEQQIGSREFARQRIGIGRAGNETRQISGYVLSPFGAEEQETLLKVKERAAKQIECWLSDDILKAMSLFNGAVSPNLKKETE